MRTPGVQPSPPAAHPEPHSAGPAGVPSSHPSRTQERGQQGGDGWGRVLTWCESALCLRMTTLDWTVWRLALLTMRLTLPTLQAAKACPRRKGEAEETTTGRCKVDTQAANAKAGGQARSTLPC